MKRLFLIAISALLFSTSVSAKEKPNAVVRTKDGVVVQNTFNNCVNTQWEGNGGKCNKNVTLTERTIYFNFGQDTLTAAGKAKLDSLSKKLKRSRNISSLKVVGYADEIGESDANQSLSSRRAKAVENYLRSRVSLSFARSEVRGLGESNSKTSCSDSLPRGERIACLSKDRRVEIEVNYLR